MKNLKSIFAICAVAAMIASCEKDDDNQPDGGTSPQPCNTVCQNGGTVTPSCDCDCPSGFTGSNCQTPVSTSAIVNVSINNGTSYLIYPIRTNGDNEYDGTVDVTIKVNLEISSDRKKIYAVNEALFYEPKGDFTTAYINPAYSSSRKLLYTAPSGKKIDYINGSVLATYGPHRFTNYTGTFIVGNTTATNHFLHKIEFIGDTSGDDLPSDGSTSKTRYKVWFDDFEVVII